MGPLSAVALAIGLILLGLTWLGEISASLHFLGLVLIIVAIVIILDAFWIGSAARYHAWRTPQ
jgi:hypothetical protein